ncbi:uncharacterized protein PHACADRAFT_189619 [Phanerochaete carnosa HHB-10118-sp]|uniref:DUF659 domain-containing protein n=1 Tax=Phanerochaete carnosa (strain HHB-10118-sp) TaxID=650164 RepID=K5XBX3_PHACS|nr:uncharacterized protein PHACADRAFT_189619 [Phanerochaete carnosa HHB-10118-sp]EKM60482.1 hypothetical protein PHACADRAFT_189619 [Phanerochaete carnosa HHB-10118-sp]
MKEWSDIWDKATPGLCMPPNATMMDDVLIPHEAAFIKEKAISYLRTLQDLTVTFYSNTTRAQESVYMVHITMPKHQVFLLERVKASGLSHIAEHTFNEVLGKVIISIGPECFCGISSDSTGNTARARTLVLKQWNWMIELSDTCHQLNPLAKDIFKIIYFNKTIKDMSGIIKHYKKSSFTASKIKQLVKETQTGQSFKSIGKTQFVTYHFAGEVL